MPKIARKVSKIKDHRAYVLGVNGERLRDVVWAFSPNGKAELKRRYKERAKSH